MRTPSGQYHGRFLRIIIYFWYIIVVQINFSNLLFIYLSVILIGEICRQIFRMSLFRRNEVANEVHLFSPYFGFNYTYRYVNEFIYHI